MASRQQTMAGLKRAGMRSLAASWVWSSSAVMLIFLAEISALRISDQ
jgi:hypothetical protein